MRLAETWKRQATRIGLVAALAAVLLWPAHAMMPHMLRLPFILALAATALSGASLLAIGLVDLLTVRRSRFARPARLFDLALGALLTLPSAAALSDLLR